MKKPEHGARATDATDNSVIGVWMKKKIQTNCNRCIFNVVGVCGFEKRKGSEFINEIA